MNDNEFMDFAAFLQQQQDVHASESGKKALETTRNVHRVRTVSQAMLVLKTVLVICILLALLVIFLFAIGYFILYFKSDMVKGMIDFVLLVKALAFVCIFMVFFLMFYNMSRITKEIIRLL
jgi:ABC-type Na+ efflux pump permease subunit